ncbi:MAG: hypothetical protein KJ749_02695 [Planctomycetes bacterium]|nr:hypothetical protein [Planctomycetota bacterium]
MPRDSEVCLLPHILWSPKWAEIPRIWRTTVGLVLTLDRALSALQMIADGLAHFRLDLRVGK